MLPTKLLVFVAMGLVLSPDSLAHISQDSLRTGLHSKLEWPSYLPTLGDIGFGTVLITAIAFVVYKAARKAFVEGMRRALSPSAAKITKRFEGSSDRFDATVAKVGAAADELLKRIGAGGVKVSYEPGGIGAAIPADPAAKVPPDVAPALDKARDLVQAGQIDEAIEHYTQLAIRFPNQPLVEWELGNLFLDSGRYDEAVKVFEEVARRQPNLPTPLHNLGLSHYRAGRYELADKAFELAMGKDSKNAQTPLLAGYSLWKLGDFDRALTMSRKALELAQQTGNLLVQGKAMNNIVYYLFELADKKGRDADSAVPEQNATLEEAEKLVGGAIELAGLTANHLDSRGCVKLWKGDFKGAADDFEAALKIAVNPLRAEHYTRALKLRGGA